MSLPLIVRGLLRSVHTTEVVYPPRTDIRCTPASRAEPGNPRQLLVRSTRPLLGRAKAGQCSLYFDHTSLAMDRVSIGGRNMLTQCLRQLRGRVASRRVSVSGPCAARKLGFARFWGGKIFFEVDG